jgi:predicted CopG family antitoxin
MTTIDTNSTKYKTLKVTRDTYDKLSELGTLKDTFDSVIFKLISNIKEHSNQK